MTFTGSLVCIQEQVSQVRAENLLMESLHAPQVALTGRIVYYITKGKYSRNINSKGEQYCS